MAVSGHRHKDVQIAGKADFPRLSLHEHAPSSHCARLCAHCPNSGLREATGEENGVVWRRKGVKWCGRDNERVHLAEASIAVDWRSCLFGRVVQDFGYFVKDRGTRVWLRLRGEWKARLAKPARARALRPGEGSRRGRCIEDARGALMRQAAASWRLSAAIHKFGYVLFEDSLPGQGITGWTGFCESCLSLFSVLRVSVSPRSPGEALEQPVCLVWPNDLVDPVILSEEPPLALGNTSPYLRICVLSQGRNRFT